MKLDSSSVAIAKFIAKCHAAIEFELNEKNREKILTLPLKFIS